VPAVSPYDLEPPMWRGLLARGAVFHATRTKISQFCELLDHDKWVKLVWLDLVTRIEEFAELDLDDDAAVQRVVTAWDDRLLDTLGRTPLEAEARQLLGELRELVRRAHGADPFLRIFTGVTARAQALYQEGWRSAALGVAHLGEHPRQNGDPYALTAATPWRPNAPVAEVELRIQPDLFGPAAFAAVPMLLIHECICHVPARQDRAANDSTFAEGLLDWVAYLYHDLWAVTIDCDLAPAALRHAETLRHILTGASGPEGRARRVGHQAARNLQTWFRRAYGHDPAVAQLMVARLAVQLNLVDRPLADKDHFVSLLGWPLPPVLQQALREWDAGDLPAEALLDVGVEPV
jgi:hypothetical protein